MSGGSLTPIQPEQPSSLAQPPMPAGGLARSGNFGVRKADPTVHLKMVQVATPMFAITAICGTVVTVLWMVTQTNPAVISVKQQEAAAKQLESAAKAIESASPKCYGLLINQCGVTPKQEPQVAEYQQPVSAPQSIEYQQSQTPEQVVYQQYMNDKQRFYARAWELRPWIRIAPNTDQPAEVEAYNAFFLANQNTIPQGF